MGYETKADAIRGKVCELLIKAYEEGKEKKTIRAGDIDDINLPNVCQAMTGNKMKYACPGFEFKILNVKDNQERTGHAARPSTNFWVTYQIIPEASTKPDSANSHHSVRNNQNIHQPTRLGPSAASAPHTLEERLKALKYMKDESIITESEFDEKIREILERL